MGVINALPMEVQTAIENDQAKFSKNIEDLKFIKETLNTPIKKRSEQQSERLMEVMMDFEYFHRRKDMKKADFVDMISKLKWESHNIMDYIYHHGEDPNKFYVILKGTVQLLDPNPAIKDRTLLYREYRNLIKWKKEEFDPLVALAKIEIQDSYIKDLANKQIQNRLGAKMIQTVRQSEIIRDHRR